MNDLTAGTQAHKADVACVEHALDQVEYGKSGKTFTPGAQEKLRHVIALLRQVRHTENARIARCRKP